MHDRLDGAPSDADLGRRLAGALRAEAGRLTPPPDAWQRFASRSAAVATRDPDRNPARAARPAGEPHPAPVQRRSPGAARRWRIPLIVAAAVAAIALATAAVVTGGFGAAGHISAANSGHASGSDGSGAGAGSSAGAKVECSRSLASAATVPVSNAAAGSRLSFRMAFAQGSPPTAELCGSFGNGDISAGGAVIPDGTPLGYLSLSGGIPDGAIYLWGAVGPAVDMVALTAVPEDAMNQTPDGSAPSASGRRDWMFASTAHPRWRISDDRATIWTALGGGWHGFAMRLPPGTGTVLAVAADAAKGAVQSRAFDVATGDVTDNTPVGQTEGTR